jgi:hypothetical protein
MEMQISPVAQNNAAAQAAPVAPKQDAQAVQAPVQQTPQAGKKDTVNLSQSAKDMAAQMSGKTTQEEAKEAPVVEMREEQAKAAK